MSTNYQHAADKVVHIFKSKYRLSRAEAEDLRSTIFVSLAELFDDPNKAQRLEQPKYLRTVINNAARDYLRTLILQRQRDKPIHELYELPSENDDHDSHIWLQEALQSLSPAQREVLCLYYGLNGRESVCTYSFNGRPTEHRYERIAKATGNTVGRVKWLYEAAIRQLKRLGNS